MSLYDNAKERMWYVDQLDARVRKALNEFPTNVINTSKVLEWQMLNGVEWTLDRIEENKRNISR